MTLASINLSSATPTASAARSADCRSGPGHDDKVVHIGRAQIRTQLGIETQGAPLETGLSALRSRFHSVSRCSVEDDDRRESAPRRAACEARPGAAIQCAKILPIGATSRILKCLGNRDGSTKRVTSAAAMSPVTENSPSWASPGKADGNSEAKPNTEVSVPSRTVGQYSRTHRLGPALAVAAPSCD